MATSTTRSRTEQPVGLRSFVGVSAAVVSSACSAMVPITPTRAAPDPRDSDAYYLDPAEAEPGDAIVRVYVSGGVACSGVLVEPRVVLTAKHCLHADSNAPRRAVEVALGAGPISWGWVAVRHTSLCSRADIAFVVLARSVPDKVSPIPLDMSGPSEGDAIVVSGFGTGMRSFSLAGWGIAAWQTRTARSGVVTGISSEVFDVNVPTERGDSGGPAIDAHGKIHGLTSKGGGATSEIARVDACVDELAEARALAHVVSPHR